MNGDGIDDFVVSVDGAANRGAWVLFGPLESGLQPNLADLPPSAGYRIKTSGNLLGLSPVGDQNDDGISDILTQTSSAVSTIVYGVADPGAELDFCSGGAGTLCVDAADPRNVGGDRIGFKVTYSSSIAQATWRGADVDGDGKDELVIPNPASGQILLVRNDIGDECPSAPGLCTIELDTLSAPDLIEITSPSTTIPFAGAVASPGDINGDGREDLLTSTGTDGVEPPALMAIYGQDWHESPVATTGLPSSDGYMVEMPFTTAGVNPFTPGDVNGDGVPDIGAQLFSLFPSLSISYSVIFGEEGTPDRALEGSPPAPGTGILYSWDPSLGLPGIPTDDVLGDLNGDGADEFAVPNGAAPVGGAPNTGSVTIIQGNVEPEANQIDVSPSSPNSIALSLTGSAAQQQFGSGAVVAGDVDGDGVNDLAVGEPGRASNGANAGWLGIVPSVNFYAEATTGLAGSVKDSSAVIGGTASANRRESTAYFEYGIDKSYGKRTDAEPIGTRNRAVSVRHEIDGLTPGTTYHYRTVVENDLGLKSYGQDGILVTDESAVDPPSPCDTDPTAAGCPKYCEANPTALGCVQPTAGLSTLIANSRSGKVRPGRRAVVWSWITNTGTKATGTVKICANVPKRKVKIVGKRCRNIGGLAPGKTGKVKFKIKVKRKTRKRAKVKIKLVASAEGVSNNRTAKVRFAVR